MSCLTLAIPGLLWPRPILRDTVFDLRLPAFEFLLGRARRRPLPALTPADWWCERLGMAPPLPAAALRRLALGQSPGEDTWLCADPIHVGMDRQGVTLDDPATLQLDADEAAALHASQHPLLTGFGALHCDSADAWHLKLHPGTDVPPLAGDLDALLGRSGSALLPAGDAGRPWRRMLNEVQMTLHDHPVNLARAAAGKPVINSLALWGVGRLPAGKPSHCAAGFTEIFSDDPVLRGLGQCAGIAAGRLPPGFAAPAGNVLVHWLALRTPTRQQDALAWRACLQQLENDWLAPALAALRRGELRRLTLLGFGDSEALALELTRSRLWQFWRRPRTMESLAA